ncbi:MAG: CheR family methyltransferase, partial [Gammaproteobacteria bacterium]
MTGASQTAHHADFYFTHEHFEFLREYIREHSGIALSDAKRHLVYTRLVRRLRSLELTGFDEYCDLIRRRDHKELVEFVNAITTNLTGFFREPHHFDYLARPVLPDLMGRNPQDRRLRLWSAGCSTGEEPYSMAMVARECVPQGAGWDLKILATTSTPMCSRKPRPAPTRRSAPIGYPRSVYAAGSEEAHGPMR